MKVICPIDQDNTVDISVYSLWYIHLTLPLALNSNKTNEPPFDIRLFARAYMRRNSLNIIKKPCEVHITAAFKTPIKLREALHFPKMDRLPCPYTLAQDILKAIRKVCITDDRLIYKLTIEKIYAEEDFITISIKRH